MIFLKQKSSTFIFDLKVSPWTCLIDFCPMGTRHGGLETYHLNGGFMLQKITTLLCISIVLVSAGTVKKVYKFSDLRVKEGYTYLKGCRPSDQGFAPAVSVKGCMLMLKPGEQAKSVSVEYGNLVRFKGNHAIEPVIPAYKDMSAIKGNAKREIMRDAQARSLLAAVYDKDALFPGIEKNPPFITGYKNGVPLTTVAVNPVQYNPVRQELYTYDRITVTVETEPVDASKEVAAYVMTPFSRSLLYQMVDNKEAVATLKLSPRAKTDYEVCIISHDAIKSKFDEYVAFNKRRGFRAKVFSVSEASQGGSGTVQEKIRAFIKKQYTDHKIVFVVLGGDVEHIKIQKLYSEAYDHNQTPDRFRKVYSGADMFYATLDGSWNNNGNNKYGEPGEEDMYFEVFLARMPADNTTHLDNMLKKTFHYAETPKKDLVKKVLMAGEFAWDDYGKTIWGADNLALFVGYQDRYGWKTHGWPEPKFDLEWITDKETGAENGWVGRDLNNELVRHKPSWINHQGHGNTSYSFSISSTQIPNVFNNTGNNQNYFISYSGGCNIMNFEVRDCFMEMMVTQSKGAVYVMGNWDNGIGDDDDNNHPSCVPIRFLHDAIFNPERRIHFIEATFAGGKESIAETAINPNALNIAPYYGLMRYCCYNTNGFGDPALSIWTDTPKDLTPTTFNVLATAEKFTIENCPPYTCVALADASTDEIFSTQITGYKYNANTSFVIGDSASSIADAAYKEYAAQNNKIKVYIKATNYLPKSFDVSMATPIAQTTNPEDLQQLTINSVGKNTLVSLTLAKNTSVSMSLYNVKGACVKQVKDFSVKAGTKKIVSLDTDGFGSGLYYCKISTPQFQKVNTFLVTN